MTRMAGTDCVTFTEPEGQPPAVLEVLRHGNPRRARLAVGRFPARPEVGVIVEDIGVRRTPTRPAASPPAF